MLKISLMSEKKMNIYIYNPEYISDGQRRKIEKFFGKMAAYYTSSEIVKLMPKN